jgi:hypothetical protein
MGTPDGLERERADADSNARLHIESCWLLCKMQAESNPKRQPSRIIAKIFGNFSGTDCEAPRKRLASEAKHDFRVGTGSFLADVPDAAKFSQQSLPIFARLVNP